MRVERDRAETLVGAELPLFWAAVGLVFFSFHLGSFPLLWLTVWAFAAGVVCSYVLFRSIPRIPNLLFHLVDPRRRKLRVVSGDNEVKACPVCGQRDCLRHPNQKTPNYLQPWDGLVIPSTVDTALTEFLEIVLDRFVSSWQRDLLRDDSFVDEFRVSIRYTAAIILRRAQKIDIPSLITGKIMQAAATHMHHCLLAKDKLPGGVDVMQLESAILQELRDHTHSALRGKTGELRYFRHLLSSALPLLVPPHTTDCSVMTKLLQELFAAQIFLPAMHFVTKPDFINKVLTIIFDKDSRQYWTVGPLPNDVPFLGAFAQRRTLTFAPLRPSLGCILNSQAELYPFMRFMASQEAIRVLQLFLSLKELKLVVEGQVPNSLHSFFSDLSSLYSTYLAPSAPTRIHLHPDPCPILEAILSSSSSSSSSTTTTASSTPSSPSSSSFSSLSLKWTRIRDTKVIQDMYLQVLQQLEETYYPQYCHSDEFYSKYIKRPVSGERTLTTAASAAERKTTPHTSHGERAAEKRKSKSLSPISSHCTEETDSDLRSEQSDSECLLLESGVTAPVPGLVQIVDYEVCSGDFNKPYTVYVILTRWEGEDGKPKVVKVKRRFKEFVELDTRLRHFYADLSLPSLPSKRTLRNMDRSFVAIRSQDLEHYLQAVITLPRIQASQLLVSFLQDTANPQLFMPYTVGERAGKIIKSVPGIRNKEKSLLLNDFLQKLVQSTEVPSSQASEETIQKVTMATSEWEKRRRAYQEQVEDDLSTSEETGVKPWLRPAQLAEPLQLEGVMDLLVYMALNVFKVNQFQMSVLLLVKLLGQRTIETYIHHFVAEKVSLLEQERVMVDFIHLLKDNLFFKDSSSRSSHDERELEWQALNMLLRYPPELLVGAMGGERYREGVVSLFRCLQCHSLNKQLFYTLLDVIVLELFPELITANGHHDNETTPSN